jgi:hypothetical protein
MKTAPKVALGMAGFCLGLVLLSVGSERLFLKATPANRLLIYSIQQELRLDMDAKNVSEVVARHTSDRVRVRWEGEESLNLSTPMGFLHGGCQLTAVFVKGRLMSSKVRGTEGPDERLHDAPPDIG